MHILIKDLIITIKIKIKKKLAGQCPYQSWNQTYALGLGSC